MTIVKLFVSNHRLLSFDGEHVAFRWRDYAHGNKQKKMTLTALEFLRRLSHHILAIQSDILTCYEQNRFGG